MGSQNKKSWNNEPGQAQSCGDRHRAMTGTAQSSVQSHLLMPSTPQTGSAEASNMGKEEGATCPHISPTLGQAAANGSFHLCDTVVVSTSVLFS